MKFPLSIFIPIYGIYKTLKNNGQVSRFLINYKSPKWNEIFEIYHVVTFILSLILIIRITNTIIHMIF